MRGRDQDSPSGATLDPVELERRRLAAEEGAKSSAHEIGAGMRRGEWSLPSKLAVALAIALVAGYLMVWANTVQNFRGPEGYVRETDFISTLTGALLISNGDGARLYDLDTQWAAQNSVLAPYKRLNPGELLPYNHIPFEALLITPLMELPYPIIFAFWTLASGLAVGLGLGMMDGALPVSRPYGWVISLAACSFFPLIRALMLGQNSPFVLMGLCALFVALRWGRWGWAGAALLLVALKPQVLPVVLLLMVLERHWRALAVFAGLMLGLSLGAMLVLGPAWPLDYARLLLGVAAWEDTGAIDPAIMHNWRGLITNLFGDTLPTLVSPLYLGLSAASAGLLAWTWLRSRQRVPSTEIDDYKGENPKSKIQNPKSDLLWAMAGVVAIVSSPHLNPHDLTLLIFPAWIIGAHAVSGTLGRTSRLWLPLLWGGYALAPLTLYGGNPALSVVPSVLLMGAATVLLAWQVGHKPSGHILPQPARA